MSAALKHHNAIIAKAIELAGGHVFKTMGDAFCAAFDRPQDAISAARAIQKEVLSQSWETPKPIRVRIAIHTGEAEEQNGDYFGPPLNMVARLLPLGRGGQTLVSSATEKLIREHLSGGVSLRDLGEHWLRDLSQPARIYQLIQPELPDAQPLLRPMEALAHNLPVQLTSFVGRKRLIEEIKESITSTRLLTLTGAGGVGKTRLAVKVAEELKGKYEDGVWYVELAAIANADLVLPTIAKTLGLREEPGTPLIQTILSHLKFKNILLLLDNCEHLLQTCAEFVEMALQSCPKIQFLATSRESLQIAGENVRQIPPLAIPESKATPSSIEALMEYEAAKLFVDRASTVARNFTVSSLNLKSISEICTRLDGIPLAIELAASRANMMPVERIAAHLKDRFDLLSKGSRTALPRHQTMRGAIDWSYELLSPPEQTLLRRLSVFLGGFIYESAELICSGDDVEPEQFLDLVSRLIDKSLILLEEGRGETERYRLLEPIREYALEKLVKSGEEKKLRARHLEYFLAIAEETELNRTVLIKPEWFNRLESDHDNFGGALDWCLDNDVEKGFILASALARFWKVRGFMTEGRERLASLLAQRDPTKKTDGFAKALYAAGNLASWQGDHKQSKRFLEDCLALRKELGGNHELAKVLSDLGIVACIEGNLELGNRYFNESLALFREVNDETWIALVLQNLGVLKLNQCDFQPARAYMEESLVLFRKRQDLKGIADQLHNLGIVECADGNYPRARTLTEEALATYRQLRDKRETANCLTDFGIIQTHLKAYVLARTSLKEAVELTLDLGDQQLIIFCLEKFGILAAAREEFELAAQFFAKAATLRETSNSPMQQLDIIQCQESINATREKLGEEEYARLSAEGHDMSLDDAIRLALESQSPRD